MARISGLKIQNLTEIANYHNDTVDSLNLFFSTPKTLESVRFAGSTREEVDAVLFERIEETDLRSCLILLASIEAALRVDYRVRTQTKQKDGLSRDFRDMYKTHQEWVGLSDQILDSWVKHHPNLKPLVGELRSALQFRHWLAHGRYWQPKWGRQYDYLNIYNLADLIFSGFPLMGN
jgi:hypothetical protein